jgi:hypothetical protein
MWSWQVRMCRARASSRLWSSSSRTPMPIPRHRQTHRSECSPIRRCV